jgi:hypothetical protein
MIFQFACEESLSLIAFLFGRREMHYKILVRRNSRFLGAEQKQAAPEAVPDPLDRRRVLIAIGSLKFHLLAGVSEKEFSQSRAVGFVALMEDYRGYSQRLRNENFHRAAGDVIAIRLLSSPDCGICEEQEDG